MFHIVFEWNIEYFFASIHLPGLNINIRFVCFLPMMINVYREAVNKILNLPSILIYHDTLLSFQVDSAYKLHMFSVVDRG